MFTCVFIDMDSIGVSLPYTGIQATVYTGIQATVYTVYRPLYTQYAGHYIYIYTQDTILCILHSIQVSLYTMQVSVYIDTLHSPQASVYTLNRIL